MSRKTAWPALGLLALTLIAYAPAMRGGFIWDDDDYVTANANLRSPAGLWNIWFVPTSSPQYYPLVHTSFWIEYQLWGLAAAGYHVVNIVLHAVAAILLWRLLAMLDLPAAWLAAAIWAVHPVQAESVAWITERKNVLSAVFYFASALTYVAWASRPCRRTYLIALVLFIAALLSKTVTCSLPAALVLILWWKHGRVTKQQWLSLAPMFVIGLAFGLFTAYWERDWVRATGPEWNFSAADRILIAGRAVWFYATKLLLPIDLAFIYPRWTIGAREQWAFPLGLIVALLTLWRMTDRWGRAPLVAALIFVGTLVPALGFFNIYPMRYSFVADHFQYHACAALLTLLAVALHRALRKFAALILIPLVLLTFWRSHILADSQRLWLYTLERNADSWMVHLNLAKAYVDRQDDASAQKHFERQVELAPQLPETHWNMGVNFARRELYDDALRAYTRAIEIDPRFPQAYYGRGRVYAQQGKTEQAMAELQKAVELKRGYGLALSELGELSVRQKRYDDAIRYYLRAVEADPMLAKTRVNLAALLAAAGRIDEATGQFNQAVQIDPSLEMYRQPVLTPRP